MADSDSEPPLPPRPPAGNPAPEVSGEQELFPGILGDSKDPPRTPGLPNPRNLLRRRKKMRAEMGFLDHLEELRVTIIKCIVAGMVGMGIMSVLFKKFFDLLRLPLQMATGFDDSKVALISIDPMGVLSMIISVTVYGGFLLSLPVMVYFIVQFVAPGLTMREKGMLRPAMFAAMLLFILGALTCFFVLLPAGLRVNFAASEMLHIHNELNVPYYYSLVVWATLGIGLVFEFPLILVILQVLGVLSPETLRGGRRYAVVIIAVVGGLLAPSPSVDSMLLTMVPMLLLYEGSIIVGAALRKRKLAADARREADNAG